MSFRMATRTGAPNPDSTMTPSNRGKKRLFFRIVLPIAAVIALLVAVLLANIATRAATPKAASLEPSGFSTPLSTASCKSKFQILCYGPAQLQTAYNLTALYNGEAAGRPITGAGETIVIAEPYGSPTIRHDLQVFDKKFKLPNPPFAIDQFGKIPPFNPNNVLMSGWAQEATLAVEYAHVFAPGAKIVLVETPVNVTVGVAGLPQLMNAQESLINKGIGDVFLEIVGMGEASFPGVSTGNYSSLLNLRYAFEDAYSHHVTVIAPSGDSGVTQTASMQPPYPLFKSKVAAWPASDPLVTGVGGTALKLNPDGDRLSPDVAWHDQYGASGGGPSAVFSRPQYQNAVAGVVGDQRGTPDISMSAAPGCWGYYSFPGGSGPGWHIFAGSTVSAPMVAGVVALADELAGHRLGLINPALYKLGELQQTGNKGTGIVSVTSGNNSFGGLTGYKAGPGYNLATGWGTIDAATFVPALARAAS